LVDIPAEIKRRKNRLIKINHAKLAIEQRRKVAYDQEKVDYDKKQQARKNYQDQTGNKPNGVAFIVAKSRETQQLY